MARINTVSSDCGRQVILEGDERKNDLKICLSEDHRPPGYPGYCNSEVAAKCPHRCEVAYVVRHTLEGTVCWFSNVIYVETVDLNPDGD